LLKKKKKKKKKNKKKKKKKKKKKRENKIFQLLIFNKLTIIKNILSYNHANFTKNANSYTWSYSHKNFVLSMN